MATYNGERYLTQQLDSLLGQSYCNWTLYIRDDGSTDKTIEIINAYRHKDERIELVDSGGIHLGAQDSFMKLLELVDSEYYMFADQDDVWLADKIKLSLEKIEQVEDEQLPSMVYTNIKVTDENLKVVADSYWRSIGYDHHCMEGFVMQAYSGYVTGCTMLFNRKAKQVSLPKQEYSPMHDWWVACQVYKNNGKTSCIAEPQLLYRRHGNNVTGQLVTSQKGKSLYRRLCELVHHYHLLKSVGAVSDLVEYLRLKKRIKQRHGNIV